MSEFQTRPREEWWRKREYHYFCDYEEPPEILTTLLNSKILLTHFVEESVDDLWIDPAKASFPITEIHEQLCILSTGKIR